MRSQASSSSASTRRCTSATTGIGLRPSSSATLECVGSPWISTTTSTRPRLPSEIWLRVPTVRTAPRGSGSPATRRARASSRASSCPRSRRRAAAPGGVDAALAQRGDRGAHRGEATLALARAEADPELAPSGSRRAAPAADPPSRCRGGVPGTPSSSSSSPVRAPKRATTLFRRSTSTVAPSSSKAGAATLVREASRAAGRAGRRGSRPPARACRRRRTPRTSARAGRRRSSMLTRRARG